jgi:hypothetical protein
MLVEGLEEEAFVLEKWRPKVKVLRARMALPEEMMAMIEPAVKSFF